jgi:hypothetical protein
MESFLEVECVYGMILCLCRDPGGQLLVQGVGLCVEGKHFAPPSFRRPLY